MKNEKDKMSKQDKSLKGFLKSLKRASFSFLRSSPYFIGIIILMGILKIFVPPETLMKIFTGKIIIDTGIGAAVGSILAGNPVNSYIISHVLLKDGISLFVTTSFIVAWVTVGVVQIPYEIQTLGKGFAITRNFLCFLLSMLVSVVTVFIVGAVS